MKVLTGTLFMALLLCGTASLGAQTYTNAAYSYDGNPYGFWITRVQVLQGTTSLLDNTSGYTAAPHNTFYNGVTPANLVPGISHTVRVTFATGSYQMHAAGWIDYNNNGSYQDTGEFIGGSGAGQQVSQPGPVIFTFTPPTGVGGVRRMRIRCAYNSGSTSGPPYGAINHSTTAWGYGEAEDYLVNLGFAIATDSQLATAAVNTTYNTTITATNGQTPYVWQFAANGYIDPSGTPPTGYTYGLPNGLGLAPSGNNLVLSGTPTQTGAFAFTVRVIDNNGTGDVSTKQFVFNVVPPPAAMPFFDDFSTNTGWQLSGPWQRGPAVAFTRSNPNQSEPGTDYTPTTTDNFILGDTIGGLYSPNQSTTQWALSPMINCTGVSAVRLRFWRWLGIAIGSKAWIQVSNNGGTTWSTVWESPSGTTIGGSSTPTWQSFSYDVSAVAAGNPVVQFRFGIGPTQADTSTGWCIDDFLVEEPDSDLEVRENGAAGNVITDNQAVGGIRDFGTVSAGTNNSITIYMTNKGPTPITFGGGGNPPYAKLGANPGQFYMTDWNSVPNPLPVGQSTSFTITFNSGQQTGVFTCTIALYHNAAYSGQSPFEINLRAEAIIPQPIIAVRLGSSTGTNIPHDQPATGTPRDFGDRDINAGPSASITLFIVNSGTGTLNISTPDMGGNWWNQFQVSTSGMQSSLTAGQSTSFTVAFNPTTIGQKDAYVRIAHTDGTQPSPYYVPVLGNGVSTASNPTLVVHQGTVTGPVIAHNDLATGTPRDFGNQLLTAGPTPNITITLENVGGVNLTLGTPVLGGVDPGEFNLITSGFQTSVASGASTSFQVNFDPNTIGTKVATISFTHNDTGVASPFIINIRGTGVNTAPNMIVRPNGPAGTPFTNPQPATGILNFGSQDVNAGPTASATIYVENTGTAALTVQRPEFIPATTEFLRDATGFQGTINPGEARTFTIQFDPTTAGTKDAVIEFVHNDSGKGTPFVLNVTGVGVLNAAILEIREENSIGTVLASGAAVVTGGPRDLGTIDISAGNTFPLWIHVGNTGNLVLNVGTPTLTGPDATHFIINNTGMQAAIGPGQSTGFEVMFDPHIGGIKDATIELSHNDPSKPSPFIIRVRGTAVDPDGVYIVNTQLPGGTADVPYPGLTLNASQGTNPYTWSVYSGSLPPGVNLTTNGQLSGTPGGFGGSYTVIIRVADTTGGTHEREYVIDIAPNFSEGRASAGGGGCAASSSRGGLMLGGLAMLAAGLVWRRRRITA